MAFYSKESGAKASLKVSHCGVREGKSTSSEFRSISMDTMSYHPADGWAHA